MDSTFQKLKTKLTSGNCRDNRGVETNSGGVSQCSHNLAIDDSLSPVNNEYKGHYIFHNTEECRP